MKNLARNFCGLLCLAVIYLTVTPLHAEIITFDPGASGPSALAVTPDGQYLYVGCGNNYDGVVNKINLFVIFPKKSGQMFKQL